MAAKCNRACHYFCTVVFGRPFVKRFALCYQTVVCLSVCHVMSCPICPVCLSATFVHCSQAVGRIKMKLGVKIGLDPGHIVLDGDPLSLPKRGAESQIFGPCLLWPNGWMDQDATWYEGRPQPRQLCVRWVPSPLPQRGWSTLPSFRPMSTVAKRLDGSKWHLALVQSTLC